MSAIDPDTPQSDDYGGQDNGQVGTIPADWYGQDGEVTWTDNSGSEHTFTVDNDHW